ncbi:hypothetical protein NM688_g5979 [Phlebia brevispora]|uniref:Uncharacterized protein n=1 Tax=Phlebia brevispora TaxID=194682 RepID=A0ACC1SLM0_9APHY|nr:hypothetical protein NM688_g5979 [Phlebia brevispora]
MPIAVDNLQDFAASGLDNSVLQDRGLAAESQSPVNSFSTPRFEVIGGGDVTQARLAQCATFFSEHYGVWDQNVAAPLRPKGRVKMTPAKLRKECFSNPDDTLLIMAFKDDQLVGQAFVTKWKYRNEIVVWVTQLVVHSQYRRRHIATGMLGSIRSTEWFRPVTIIGIASTHPAACNTLANLARFRMAQVDLSFIRQNAAAILECATPRYLRGAKLHGELFEEACTDGAVSLADTNFPVDHAEPHQVLETYVSANKWPLGSLRDGHEFVLVISLPEEECRL